MWSNVLVFSLVYNIDFEMVMKREMYKHLGGSHKTAATVWNWDGKMKTYISCCCPAETWFVSEVTETGIVSEACFDPRISIYLAFLLQLLIADDDSDDDVKDDASETWFVSEVMSEYWATVTETGIVSEAC